MNYEQYFTLAKQMLNMYFEKEGRQEGELQVEVIISMPTPEGRKGLLATNKSDAIFEINVNLEEKKSYLVILQPMPEKSLSFDLTISNKKENEKNE